MLRKGRLLLTDEPIQLEDAQVRREAILTPDHAFVWASAGTGKTHTLTVRALYLLLTPQQNTLYRAPSRLDRLAAARETIRSIVLTTFTRKAAAEMQTRLFRYFDCIASSESLEDLHRAELIARDPLLVEILEGLLRDRAGGSYPRLRMASEALAELASELQIFTIHSFAASLLRRHPLEAGIPADVRFAREDEDDLAGLEDQIIECWWQRRVLHNSPLQQNLSAILNEVPLEDVQDWLKTCISHPWLARAVDDLKRPEPWLEQRMIATIRQLAANLDGSRGKKLETAREGLLKAVEAIERGLPQGWLRLAEFLEAQKDYLFLSHNRKPPKAITRAIDAVEPDLQSYFQNFYELSIPVVQLALFTSLGDCFESWRKVLRDFAGWARDAGIRELGLVGFDDMIRLSVRLLEKHPQVRRSEQNRLRALLVDEFQDTDPLQLRLIQLLLAADPGWNHQVIAFFVGDKKQSIYRFRGADIPSIEAFHGSFGECSNDGVKHREFQLQTSFRSLPAVTEFVNQFFDRECLNLAGAFERLIPFRTGVEKAPLWIAFEENSSGEALKAEQGRQLAAQETVRLIEEHVAKGDSEGAAYRDVLILTRTNRELESLLPSLHEAGIPVVSSGTRTFYRHHEVLDLLNLLIALYHPLDTLAAAVVLRSPVVCLSDDQIHQLFQIISPSRLFHERQPLPAFLPASGRRQIERLRELALCRKDLPTSSWINRVRRLIPTTAYLDSRDQEGRALLRLNRVLERFLEEAQSGSLPACAWLIKQRERAAGGDSWDSDLGEDVSVADESIEAVRAMTIHKAKGLEAKLVIVYGWTSLLASLADSSDIERSTILDLTAAQGESLRAFSLPWGPLHIRSPNFSQAVEEEKKNSYRETLRLAYVTATRARDRMIFLTHFTPRQKVVEPVENFLARCRSGDAPNSLEFTIKQAVEPVTAGRRPSPTALNAESYQQIWRKRYLSRQSGKRPLLHSPTREEERRPVFTTENDSRTLPSDAAFTGILVHRYLELYLQDSSFDPGRLTEIYHALPDKPAGRDPLSRAARILERFFQDEPAAAGTFVPRKRIGKGKILGREVPVYVTVEEQSWHGIIDLILLEEDTILGIDFKTGSPLDPLPESYQRQRRIYSRALQQACPEQRVQFEFWWLGSGEG